MILCNKYRILAPINSGSYGTIYKGENIRTGELVAIKIEDKQPHSLLVNESKIYIYLAASEGIPQAKWFGVKDNKHILVMPLLDMTLSTMRKTYGKMEWINVMKIGIQMIRRLQFIHTKELIHRDIKPDNWLFGRGEHSHILYLVDFGFCKRYRLPNGNHISLKQTSNIIGTLNYASLNVHNKMEPSRRDDLESAVYCWMYLLDELPWEHLLDSFSVEELKKRIVSIPHLVHNVLKDILIYVRHLEFEETPDYEWIISRLSTNISSC
uniref:Protein kinase domain-containing protein n=1 Tax=viral metagenome TaxID=1070528 RepID=A0A6C0E3N8_9ZZZZ